MRKGKGEAGQNGKQNEYEDIEFVEDRKARQDVHVPETVPRREARVRKKPRGSQQASSSSATPCEMPGIFFRIASTWRRHRAQATNPSPRALARRSSPGFTAAPSPTTG